MEEGGVGPGSPRATIAGRFAAIDQEARRARRRRAEACSVVPPLPRTYPIGPAGAEAGAARPIRAILA
ncbi:hypothetical protein ElP_01700 [Tautonia plasticadhaerens]|uniref:Uncharacterized protein n=1 Tax=Tautonia plasticadhaerens TaxID=2527974 RepID=A0A518GUT2_9BACT|nr:hypothetical protein ElP_01700 [Tautonia plasticadhaerens]